MINLVGYSEKELQEKMIELGEPKFRGSQIYKWIYEKNCKSFDEMVNLSKQLRQRLKENYTIEHIEVLECLKDPNDGTQKFLLSLKDDNIIESVLMKYSHGYSLCISTQVGCNMGCNFCASTLEGAVRNLTSGEIIDQILVIQDYAGVKISNIVLMGSGEPLDNYQNVLKFIYNVNNKNGLNIGQRHITLSTCGIVKKIYDLAEENLQINLSISLHAPNNTIRSEMMPINKVYPLEDLIESCKYYFEKTRRRITFEYAMVKGKNDSLREAEELYQLLKGLNCLVNLIPINEFKESSFKKSNKTNIMEFRNYLQNRGITTTIRRELGSSINAACGQLRRRYRKNP